MENGQKGEGTKGGGIGTSRAVEEYWIGLDDVIRHPAYRE